MKQHRKLQTKLFAVGRGAFHAWHMKYKTVMYLKLKTKGKTLQAAILKKVYEREIRTDQFSGYLRNGHYDWQRQSTSIISSS